MGVEKHSRPVLHQYGTVLPVQALTGGSTGTTLANHGVVTITSTGNGTAANLIFTLGEPDKGKAVTIVVDSNSTKLITVRTASSTETFFGSTKNSIQWSTGSTSLPSAARLIGLSSSQYLVEWLGTPLADSTAVITREVSIAGATA